jgi:hypothetical protein
VRAHAYSNGVSYSFAFADGYAYSNGNAYCFALVHTLIQSVDRVLGHRRDTQRPANSNTG